MISKTNLCSLGCVIFWLIAMLNNSHIVDANAKSNAKRVNEATAGPDASASLQRQWRYVRDDYDRTKIVKMMDADAGDAATTNTSKQRLLDDRLIFDRPAGYAEPIPTTKRPIKSNSTAQNLFEVDGEYSFGVRLKEGTRHGERGEYELRNGKPVFIIRGYFGRVAPTGDYHITAYVFDHTGYHEIPVESGVIDFRPEIDDGECDLAAGNYCIDQKLLTLMVG